MSLEGKPCLDHAANYRGLSWHLEPSNGLARERVRKAGQFFPLQLAPTTAVAVSMPDQVDRAFPHASPIRYLYGVLHHVDLYQRTGRNQLSHRVVFQSDHSIAISFCIKVDSQGRWQSGQFLRVQFEQAGLVAGEVCLEVNLKAETKLWYLDALWPCRTRFTGSGELPYLIGVNSKH